MTQSAIRYFFIRTPAVRAYGNHFCTPSTFGRSRQYIAADPAAPSGSIRGTLAGILGSLLAAVGGLVLDWTSLSTVNRAQDFIHRHILPTLPERRIAVRIEDAVLVLIAEKAAGGC